MISAGVAVFLAFGAGVVLGGLGMGFVAGGAKTSMCDECPYKLKYLSSGKGSYKVPPPPKHPWEITHADKPVRSNNRQNGRKY